MSISSIINRNNYIGNDSTAVYPYSFKVYTKNDFEIKVRNSSSGLETLLTVDFDYTVSGAGTVSGGNITLIGSGDWLVSSKLTSGYELSIRRLREIKQLADIKNQGSFFPEVHEDVFDKLVMIDLQQQDSIDRSVKLPSSINPSTFDASVPASIVGSANRAFITNAAGDGFDVGPTADEISGAQAAAIAADASALASSLSAADAASSAAASAAEVAGHASLTTTHGVSGDIVGTATSQTLTNKTLTTPVISQILNTGTITLPTSTDTLVGRSTTDALTNKDIDGGVASDTRRITLPKDAKTNLDSLTRKQGTLVYDTTSNKPYYDDGVNLKVIGSGSGGSINFIENGDADNAPSSILVPYIGSGATPGGPGAGTPSDITTALTSTSPLSGTKSFLFTKTGSANTQGLGGKIAFTVDPAYRAKMLKISFDHILNSGTCTTGDVCVYIWDLTNGVAIEPTNIKLETVTSLSNKFEASFQTSASGVNYQVMIYVATTTTNNFEIKLDNISVSPSQYVYAPSIIDPILFSSTLTNFGNASQNLFYSRSGAYLLLEGTISIGTTAPTGVLTFSLPPGLVVDTAKMGAGSSSQPVATAVGYRNSTAGSYRADVFLSNGSNNQFTFRPTDGTNNPWTTTVPITWASGSSDRIMIYGFKAPIQGWTSNQQVSDGYDARELTLIMKKTSSQLLTSGANTKITFDTTTLSKGLVWDATNSRVVCISAGTYQGEAGLVYGTSGAGEALVMVYKNNINFIQDNRSTTPTLPTPKTPFKIDLIAGDYIEVFGVQSTAGALNVTSGFLSISKLQAPTTMSRGATFVTRVSTNATTSYTTGVTAVFAPATIDTAVTTGAGGTYNTATGEFTASSNYTLDVCYHIMFNNASWNAVTRIDTALWKNGVTTGQGQVSPYAQTAVSFVGQDKGCFTVDVKSGDVIKLMMEQNSGSAKTLIGISNYNWIVFKRAGG